MTLVTTMFFAQNQFYADAILRSHVQENVRSVTEWVASELRGVGNDAFTMAESRQFIVRKPIVIGAVCETYSDDVIVYFPLDGEMPDTTFLGGYSLRDDTGAWAYYAETSWAALENESERGPLSAAEDCDGNGADTVGAIHDFYSLHGTGAAAPVPDVGWPIALYETLHYQFKASDLEEGTIGLYFGRVGGTLVELATGMTPGAGFQYRLKGETTYASTVSESDLGAIDAVRLIATGESLGQLRPNGENSYSFGWTLDVILKNAH